MDKPGNIMLMYSKYFFGKMIEKLKKLLTKLSEEDLDTGIKFEECEITVDDRIIKINGELDMEVKEK